MMSAVVALILVALDGGAAPATKPFDWAVPKLIASAPVGQRLEVNGQALTVSVARSSWDPPSILRYFIGRFEAAGFYVQANVRLPGIVVPNAVAFDAETMTSYVVWVWPDRGRTTTMVLGASDARQRSQRRAQGGLPLFPGATKPTTFNLEFAQALAFTAKATEAEVLDFYRATLPSGGFHEREPGVFVKGHRAVRVMARAQNAGLGVVLLEEPDYGDVGAWLGVDAGSTSPTTRSP